MLRDGKEEDGTGTSGRGRGRGRPHGVANWRQVQAKNARVIGPCTFSMRRRENDVVEMEKLWVCASQVGPLPPPQSGLGEHGRILISDGPVILGQTGHIVSSPPAWISRAPLRLVRPL